MTIGEAEALGLADDTVVVFIAGHGVYDRTGEATYYYLTHEADLADLAGSTGASPDVVFDGRVGDDSAGVDVGGLPVAVDAIQHGTDDPGHEAKPSGLLDHLHEPQEQGDVADQAQGQNIDGLASEVVQAELRGKEQEHPAEGALRWDAGPNGTRAETSFMDERTDLGHVAGTRSAIRGEVGTGAV